MVVYFSVMAMTIRFVKYEPIDGSINLFKFLKNIKAWAKEGVSLKGKAKSSPGEVALFL